MTIKHIVITGGGHIGLSSLGVLTETFKKGQWDINNIESIWGSSSGSMIAVMLCLKMDFETINKYTLERPWSFLSITTEKIINLVSRKGLFGIEEYYDFYKPLFLSCDLSIDLTMKELYDYSKIELNMITTELNSFESTVINHKTFPDLSVIQGIMMSSSIPILIKPVKYNEKLYFDGALFINFPIITCQEEKQCNYDEILGIRRKQEFSINQDISKVSNLFDYLFLFTVKMLMYCHKTPDTSMYSNMYIIDLKQFSLHDVRQLTETTYRKKLFDYGVNIVTPTDLSGTNLTKIDSSDNIIIDDSININNDYYEETYSELIDRIQKDLII